MRPRTVLYLAILLTLCAAGAPLPSPGHTTHAQDGQARALAVAPAGGISSSAGTVDVAVNVEHVSNLAGFQFVLTVDPAVLQPDSVKKTLFLAGTGREIVCSDPTIDEASVRVACVTLRETPAGVDGDGTVANVTFKVVGKGSSALALTHVKLVHPDGSELPSTGVDGTATVSGDGSSTSHTTIIIVAIAGAVAVLALAAGAMVWRRRSATAARPE